MTAKVETVRMCFAVAGKDLMRIARDTMLSEMPDTAWRILQSALPDAPEKEFRAVLDGTRSIAGDSSKKGLFFTSASSKSYQKSLAYIYAGRIRMDRRWWRPVAVVTFYGPADLHYAVEEHETIGGDMAERRATAHTGKNERIVFIEAAAAREHKLTTTPGRGRVPVVFEPCGEPPFWWTPIMTPTNAIASALVAGRTLDERGYSAEDYKEANDDEDVVGGLIDASLEKQRWRKSDAELEQAALAHTEFLAGIAAEVRKRAGDYTFELKVEDRVLTVPRAPFEHWALSRTALRHLAAPWKPVSPSGLKMPLDDEWHTDWLLAAGVDIENRGAYDSKLMDAAYEAAHQIQERLGHFEAMVIVGGDDVEGVIGKDILVLPNLHPDHAEAMLKSKAVITQQGGQLAHLATVGREMGIPILLVKDALTRYPKNHRVYITPSKGRIDILGIDRSEDES